jgi:hypothetical protein
VHARLPGGYGVQKCAARNAYLAHLLGGVSARLEARGHRKNELGCHSGDLEAAGCFGYRLPWTPLVGAKGSGGARELEVRAAADHSKKHQRLPGLP